MARSTCTVCNQIFSSTSTFDRHRIGRYERNGRRCLTSPELVTMGMYIRAGIWSRSAPTNTSFRYKPHEVFNLEGR